MDWSKVDAALAAALAAADDPETCLTVFVHLDSERADPSLLVDLDLRGAPPGGVCTGTVSVRAVEELTDQPWVTRVHLSGRVRLLR